MTTRAENNFKFTSGVLGFAFSLPFTLSSGGYRVSWYVLVYGYKKDVFSIQRYAQQTLHTDFTVIVQRVPTHGQNGFNQQNSELLLRFSHPHLLKQTSLGISWQTYLDNLPVGGVKKHIHAVNRKYAFITCFRKSLSNTYGLSYSEQSAFSHHKTKVGATKIL